MSLMPVCVLTTARICIASTNLASLQRDWPISPSACICDFNLPSESPVNPESMNHTCAAIGLVAICHEIFHGHSDFATIEVAEGSGVLNSQKARTSELAS
ncbi:GABA permease [Penicillium argentinense]|uniref:GABA permease n=1 Tax=Penicillium argentinense TaxID=1131581 RepID=A0A9W9EX87_9EURO|nr:GABA permease [Penicillium argentinense]KAJ5089546.1 GABA permease [Penicillium argentinense]